MQENDIIQLFNLIEFFLTTAAVDLLFTALSLPLHTLFVKHFSHQLHSCVSNQQITRTDTHDESVLTLDTFLVFSHRRSQPVRTWRLDLYLPVVVNVELPRLTEMHLRKTI